MYLLNILYHLQIELRMYQLKIDYYEKININLNQFCKQMYLFNRIESFLQERILSTGYMVDTSNKNLLKAH